VDPCWWQAPLSQPSGVKPCYSDLEDVKKTIRRARNAGMQILLDFHYSDFWADPSRQLIPRRWLGVAENTENLKDSVYNYTRNTLENLDAEGLMPDIVQVGNETNPGILKHVPAETGYETSATVSDSWPRHGILFNSAIKAIRDAGNQSTIKPKIAVHFAGSLIGHDWTIKNFTENARVTDFDIFGISYYYAWHKGNINLLETTLKSLTNKYTAYKFMVLETGYPWTTRNFDQMPNIITSPDPDYLPVIPEKQLEYLVDYTRAVMRGGGIGVVFWEPAWVSTPCRTPWGVGSSHDHVVFFDPLNRNFMDEGGGRWMKSTYYDDLTTQKITFKVDMAGQDTTGGVYITGSFTGDPWKIIPMASEGGGIFSYFTYLKPSLEGGYLFLNGNTMDSKETVPEGCAAWQDSCRKYITYQTGKTYGHKWGSCETISGENPDLVKVTFAVNMAGKDVSRGVFVTGAFTGDPWKILRMTALNDSIYFYKTSLLPGKSGAYYFLTTSTWDNYQAYREKVPSACAKWWNTDRGYVIPEKDTTLAFYWGSCSPFSFKTSSKPYSDQYTVELFPNPTSGDLNIRMDPWMETPIRIKMVDTMGHQVLAREFRESSFMNQIKLDLSHIPAGLYVLILKNQTIILNKKIIIK
jgi:arabinogalactan endo-1,4-beta-galactosidase